MVKKKVKTVKRKTTTTKKKQSIKKKSTKKKSITSSIKKPKTKLIKKTSKKTTKKVLKKSEAKSLKVDKTKKIPKAISGFNDKIKEIFAKLINKHKVDGIYTQKIIEKAIPKKFRLDETLKNCKILLFQIILRFILKKKPKN